MVINHGSKSTNRLPLINLVIFSSPKNLKFIYLYRRKSINKNSTYRRKKSINPEKTVIMAKSGYEKFFWISVFLAPFWLSGLKT